MPRALRIEYEAAVYHVMSRGDRREAIFLDSADRERFLQTLEEACEKTGWQVHALCLMNNHFHLVIETPSGNLVVGMKWLLGTYTSRFNRRHKLIGHLFSGRYKALVIDADTPGNLRTVCDYVHLNPVRANLLKKDQELRDFPWSSYPQYLLPPRKRWPWLRVDRLLGEMGFPGESAASRKGFAKYMNDRTMQELEVEDWKKIRRGWYFGADSLKAELLQRATQRVGANQYGVERREVAEAKADRLVREGLVRIGWSEADLSRQLKGDPEKVRIARVLREQTTVSLALTAARLKMGSWTYVSNLPSQSRRR